jgi:D-alanyl-D-alanine carboxypeptidase
MGSVKFRRVAIGALVFALLLVVALAVTACGQEKEARWQGAAPTTTKMSAEDAAIVDQLAKAGLDSSAGQLPAMWIGVWDPAKGYYVGAYGEAVTAGAAATVADHSRIGSVTKTFTAVAILEQVEAGKLALADTIEKVLPDMAKQYPNLAPITIEQLVAMRSGIPDYANTGIVTGKVVEDPYKVWTVDEIIAATMAEGTLQPPGTGGYSTTNYLILGEMLEKVTGKSPENVITDVAKRAGLTRSMLQNPAETKMPDPASHGYMNQPGADNLAQMGITVEPGQDVSDWTVSWGQAGGGMYSTLEDLKIWAASGLGNTLLPKSLGDQRLQAQPIPEGNYGLGIFDWGNGWIGHTGQLFGWESFCAYNKDSGAVFVAIDNETASLAKTFGIMAAFFPELLQGLVGQ